MERLEKSLGYTFFNKKLLKKEILSKIHDALLKLTEREQKILEMWFGLNWYTKMTLAEVGKILGISANRVK